MFGIDGAELIIILFLLFLLFLLAAFSLGYYIGLSRGIRERNAYKSFDYMQ